MSRLHAIELHLLMLAGIAFLCVSGWQVWRVGKVLDAANNAIQGVNGTIANLNRPCGTLKPCGTLADVAKTLNTIRMTAGTLEVAARHENRNLDTLDAQEGTLFADAHGALTQFQGTARAATETLHALSGTANAGTMALNGTTAALTPLIEAGTATVKHYDAMAPALSATADNVQRMTADGARITKDAADEADKLAHPPKKKLGFWGGFWVGMQYVHKFMPSIF